MIIHCSLIIIVVIINICITLIKSEKDSEVFSSKTPRSLENRFKIRPILKEEIIVFIYTIL